ncbi:hypothetical protein QBC34DRAFT_424201 [Podospora aff. communis PSN243]|uniref:Uncharacterized protein n=1 Tax=Podospora aff. communis PSN243 TaxID=3040156 RepID=A0AAV9GSW0_9PEZI|nr:hypothetical protein QBC34DRAFT_424201 [Podospora aff. communis PSN243]
MHPRSIFTVGVTALALHPSTSVAYPTSAYAAVSARKPLPGPGPGNIQYHGDPAPVYYPNPYDSAQDDASNAFFTGHGAALIGVSPHVDRHHGRRPSPAHGASNPEPQEGKSRHVPPHPICPGKPMALPLHPFRGGRRTKEKQPECVQGQQGE